MVIFWTPFFLESQSVFYVFICSKTHNKINVHIYTMASSYVTIAGVGGGFLKVGYARVSTGLQNLDLQNDSLHNFGCEKIFTDQVSGARGKRPGLESALEFVREGDTLVVWRLDRLGRNMEDLISIVNRLNERRIGFHSLQETITMDKTSSTGQLMFHLFAAFAEFERNLILERTAAGRVAARARGRVGGRPDKLKKDDIKLVKTLADNKIPIKNIAQKFGVSRTTVYRYLNEPEE